MLRASRARVLPALSWLWRIDDLMPRFSVCCAAGTKEPNAPTSFCFTSGETNWSNNPVLFPRTWFNEKIREVALSDFEHNNLFEFRVMLAWLQFKPPAIVCVSEQGIFTHHEIDQ